MIEHRKLYATLPHAARMFELSIQLSLTLSTMYRLTDVCTDRYKGDVLLPNYYMCRNNSVQIVSVR